MCGEEAKPTPEPREIYQDPMGFPNNSRAVHRLVVGTGATAS